MNSEAFYQAVFNIAAALEVPVIIGALIALAVVLFELGVFTVELLKRRRRTVSRLKASTAAAAEQLEAGDTSAAVDELRKVAWSVPMRQALDRLVECQGSAHPETEVDKLLADFDSDRQRQLSHTRLLVRVGPALGLMGTLIPLSPALESLANGDVEAMTDDLRVAFSVTVLGILVGVIAFGISLVRDRIYGQDYSDLEYAAAVLSAAPRTAADEQGRPG